MIGKIKKLLIVVIMISLVTSYFKIDVQAANKPVFGSARIDERDKASGGKAGDQTKKEVTYDNYYKSSKGWYVLRAKNINQANLLAKRMMEACNNDNIGYDQSQRNTLYNELVKGASMSSVSSCETDCSALVRAILYTIGIKVGDFTTANERSVLLKSGYFTDVSSSINFSNGQGLRFGDILVTRKKGHTVIVVKGPSATVDLSYSSVVYNGNAMTPSLTVRDVSGNLLTANDYTVNYSNNVNAGTANVTVTLNSDNSVVNKTFNIAKANASVSLKDDSFKYTGQPVTLSTPTHVGDSKIYYQYYSDAACTKKISTPVNGGYYYVKAFMAETANYKAATSNSARVMIYGQDSSITLSDRSVYYSGKPIVYPTPNHVGNGTVTYEYYADKEGKEKIETPVNLGTYYVKASIAKTETYNAATSNIAKVTIIKRNSSITLKDQTVAYTGNEVALPQRTYVGNGAISYQYYADPTCLIKISRPVNIGTYYVKETIAETAQYKAATSNVAKVTITKATPTLTIGVYNKTYKYRTVKKANKYFTLNGKASNNTSLTYSKVGGSKYLSVSSNGTIQVKKKTKKGTHTIYVRLSSSESETSYASNKTFTIKVKVK